MPLHSSKLGELVMPILTKNQKNIILKCELVDAEITVYDSLDIWKASILCEISYVLSGY